jgi:hypothetical protein
MRTGANDRKEFSCRHGSQDGIRRIWFLLRSAPDLATVTVAAFDV